jgi:hypothetical protein
MSGITCSDVCDAVIFKLEALGLSIPGEDISDDSDTHEVILDMLSYVDFVIHEEDLAFLQKRTEVTP